MYVYGKNVVKELIKSNYRINKAFITNSFNDEFIISSLKNLKIEIEYIDKFRIDKLVNGVHQGIVLKVADYEYKNLSDLLVEDSKVVILDHLEDVHNFGAIIRTCEAAGVNGIIIPKNRSVIVNDTVFKTSAGAVALVNIVMVTNISDTIRKLKKEGFWIVGTDMSGENFRNIDYSGKRALVIGNEGDGMSKNVFDSVDFVASIPMKGNVNSLNASVAAGIIVFEMMK